MVTRISVKLLQYHHESNYPHARLKLRKKQKKDTKSQWNCVFSAWKGQQRKRQNEEKNK